MNTVGSFGGTGILSGEAARTKERIFSKKPIN